jgi:capsular exopolysaccharide synthesis family protein
MHENSQPSSNAQANDERLPFDLRTIFIGLLRRWWIFSFIFLIFSVLGILGGMFLGSRTYQAYTVLLFNPVSFNTQEEIELKSPLEANTVMQYRRGGSDKDSTRSPYQLQTRRHMVKIPRNLEAIRDRLQLPLSTKALGAMTDVTIQKDTDLLIISAKGETAQMASDIANALRDEFLKYLEVLRTTGLRKQIDYTMQRLADIQTKWESTSTALTEFINANQILDINEEVKWRLNEITSIDRDYTDTIQERDTYKIKIENAERLMQELESKAAEEKNTLSQTQNIQDLSIRIERLRDSIYDDKSYRSNMADLAEKETAMDRAKRLFQQGMITKVEHDKAIASYEKQKAVTIDTDEIKQWKKEIDKLQSSINPGNDGETPSTSMLQDMMMRMMDVQLNLVAAEERIKYLEIMRTQAKAKLDQLPSLQRAYARVSREANIVEAERRTLEDRLNQVQLDFKTEQPEFEVVSAASPPLFAMSSNRRLIAIAFAFMGFCIGLLTILGLELLDTTIKSPAEATLKFALPILGVIPNFPDDQLALTGKKEFLLMEPFRLIAQKIRRFIPQEHARIMIVSADKNEGKTLVTANLAIALGRQDEHVLIIDGNVRPDDSSSHLLDLIPKENQVIKGIGEYLSYDTDNIHEIVWPIDSPGVECLPRVGNAITPDMIGSKRMKELLDDVSQQFSLVLLDSPPIFPFSDASLLAKWCDGIIVVVRCKRHSAVLIQSALSRLKEAGSPILGVIVNGVDPVYLDASYKYAFLNSGVETS